MVHAMAVSLIFFAALAALGALFVARRVLRRIDAMNRSARAIMGGDLSPRLPVSGSGDELDRLAAGLNDMLGRIADLMAGMREVSDNIAHDLRTPLTRLRNHAEEALRCATDPAAYRAALERTIEESDGLIAVFNALLMIARAEAGADSAGVEPSSTSASGRRASPSSTSRSPRKTASTLTIEAARGLTVLGNRELIGQAVANLIDNAVKYGARRGRGGRRKPRSPSTARRDGASVAIEVADRGPGIPADDRARALERFVRLEGARSRPGSGLGLSLAAAVMRMHGGALRLDDNEPGLKVTATLPAAAIAPNPRRTGRGVTAARSASACARRRGSPARVGPPASPSAARRPAAAALAPLVERKATRELLLGVADHSPFLWSLIEEDPARLARLLAAPPEDALDAADRRRRDAKRRRAGRADARAAPRQARVGAADRARRSRRRLGRVAATEALTRFADAAVGAALRFLFAARRARDGSRSTRKRRTSRAGCGLVVLALGKHGARELNYSSDIDLIVLFDAEAARSPTAPSRCRCSCAWCRR